MSDIWQRHDHETPGMRRERGLHTLFHCKERQWIPCVDPVGISYCHARLSYATSPFFDKALVSRVKWLIAPDEQCRRLLRINGRPKFASLEDTFLIFSGDIPTRALPRFAGVREPAGSSAAERRWAFLI